MSHTHEHARVIINNQANLKSEERLRFHWPHGFEHDFSVVLHLESQFQVMPAGFHHYSRLQLFLHEHRELFLLSSFLSMHLRMWLWFRFAQISVVSCCKLRWCLVKQELRLEALAADIRCIFSRTTRICDSVPRCRLLTGCLSAFFSQTNENYDIESWHFNFSRTLALHKIVYFFYRAVSLHGLLVHWCGSFLILYMCFNLIHF